ncbi:MAG: SpoIIE family protein phosphatase [Candidatus Hydrogenedentota bacterium]|nr:MAG: SpoIIE family protein phosphatase [Candidatus Hydrogenedentota bacterium]
MSQADETHNGNRPDSESDAILINWARRAVIKPRRLGACVVTGTDKIRSGFGNGDCLMLDFKNLVFAVSDATERFPFASRSLLTRFAGLLTGESVPGTKADWLDLINALYARQTYNHKTTLSCVALHRQAQATTAYVIHGGDSIVLLINLGTRKIEYTSSPDMCFAGRAKGLTSIAEISIENGDYGFIIASDGIADTARLSGRTLEKVSGSVLSRLPLHEIPEGLARYLNGLPDPAEYDDIGLIALSPTKLEDEDHPTILIGGTTPAEETAFQRRLASRAIDDRWVTLRGLKPETGVNFSGVVTRNQTLRI